MKRKYPDCPILATAGVIFNEDMVLLAKRKQEPGKGQWSLPGGVVELGEKVEDALRRELWEELGIRVKIGGLVRLADRIVLDRKGRVQFHYVIADYWGSASSRTVSPGSDVTEAQFVPLNKLGETLLPKEVLETILMADEIRTRDLNKSKRDVAP
ncbi:MAG: NUDIX hydrolase [Deltaproteobacteria bacterium]|nr:NUDIX hydrolase [Deltaproteobacteria bacterium]MBW1976639.1 NUDIX hydrolase [Deltaproteobacteria bacterium]MBW2045046.1 NUDIX hydrolase [Deltaproteobacteria bacterium]MBW2299297.1 NUDIX hydrolase [Deltaproteobacteria bacterium]